jgi:hypothetical protein
MRKSGNTSLAICAVILMHSNKFIFTNHALERLQQRSISQSMAESVLHNPDRTETGKKPGTVKFIRTLNGRNIQIVATLLEDQRKWLVVSAWVRGEDDKVPFVWQVITLPFRFSWWLLRTLFKLIMPVAKK